jgi:2-dehydro-3-deoxyphosphogluconate aldolase/(4S)-4-hydroxy-2-oxoglutarate aldolase
MTDASLTARELEEIGLIAIVRTDVPAPLTEAARALVAGGVRAVEITLNTPGALEAITHLRHQQTATLRIGVGTVLDADDARRAIESGAEFVVTPTLQPDTIAVCRERGIPSVCGCMTPTEALAAHRAGADFIKVFPADTLGVAYVRAILAPLPFLKLIPTGGVGRDNIADFIRAGCAGVALGSNLVGKDILRDGDWDRLTRLAQEYVQSLADARAACVPKGGTA